MPYVGSTLFFTALIVGLLLSMGGSILVVAALWPRFAERAEGCWTESPGLSCVIGIPIALVLLTGSLALSKAPMGALKFAGMVGVMLVLAVGLIGMSGLVLRIARNTPAPRGATPVVRAVVMLELAFAFPLLGWFVALPIALFGSVGAAILAVFSKPMSESARQKTLVSAPEFLPAPSPANSEGHVHAA